MPFIPSCHAKILLHSIFLHSYCLKVLRGKGTRITFSPFPLMTVIAKLLHHPSVESKDPPIKCYFYLNNSCSVVRNCVWVSPNET